jgi:hypothetical protein
MEYEPFSNPAPDLEATLTRLIGFSVRLTLEGPRNAGELSMRGLVVAAFDQPRAPREGNLALLVGPHLIELHFGRVEKVQIGRNANGNGHPTRVRLLLEGESVMEIHAIP